VTPRRFWRLLLRAIRDADRDRVPLLGAALSFYMLFSLAPLLLIATAVAGAMFGEEAARGEIAGRARHLFGEAGAEVIQNVLRNASVPTVGVVATAIGLVAFTMGATAAFNALQGALNTVWNVTPRRDPIVRGFLRRRFLSFLLVLALGALTLLTLLFGTAASAVGERVTDVLHVPEIVWRAGDFALSVALSAVLLALIYKVLPDIDLEWRHVWAGAVITAVFFVVGRFVIGLWLGRAGIGSGYGAAGSVVLIMFWVYYSAQVMLLGAEFTQVYVNERGSKEMPAPKVL
jgi:membrane protein